MGLLRHSGHATAAAIAPVKGRSARSRGASSLRVRRFLMSQRCRMIDARRLNQVQAARWLHIGQPRVSQLLRGQADRFSTDTLLDMLALAGLRVRVDIADADTLDHN